MLGVPDRAADCRAATADRAAAGPVRVIYTVLRNLARCVWSNYKQQNTQYYAGGRNGGGRTGATHTYGARPMDSRKLMGMAEAACITEVAASANAMAADTASLCVEY